MEPNSILLNRLDENSAVIAVIGLGYVGLPLALAYSFSGYKVIGFDIDKLKVSKINNGESYIHNIDSHLIRQSLESSNLIATDDFSMISECDALAICVPTPLTQYREPDLSYIKSTLSTISPYLRKNQILSLESTTYPGTTDEIVAPIISSLGFTIGDDFYLVYSPEREDPGNTSYSTSTIPKILGGYTKQCSKLGEKLYSSIVESVVVVSSTKTAEMTKLLENIHRAVNIGLMNELKPLSDSMGIDLYEVIEAASTKPFGFVPYYPGPGLGGHCIPIDPFYLTWKAREFGMHTRFIELAGEINASMPQYVVSKIIDGLNQAKLPINGSKILVLGISYKRNVDDVRESPSVEIMSLLANKGAHVSYSDPYFQQFPKMRKYNFDLQSVSLSKEILSDFDVVVLTTDHDCFDYRLIHDHSKLIVDTRGKFSACDRVLRA